MVTEDQLGADPCNIDRMALGQVMTVYDSDSGGTFEEEKEDSRVEVATCLHHDDDKEAWGAFEVGVRSP